MTSGNGGGGRGGEGKFRIETIPHHHVDVLGKESAAPLTLTTS